MITKDKITADKLRGGFYSPAKMVDLALERVFKDKDNIKGLKVLEPSCGDGAFIDGLSRKFGKFRGHFDGVELIKEEADKAEAKLLISEIEGKVINRSFFSVNDLGDYDVVVGNPPYLRYQFIEKSDKSNIESILLSNNIEATKVANIWIPLTISALSKLKKGGRFALIIPDESMTGISAMGFRKWIVENFSEIQIDIFPVGIFPNVLQETIIISGKREKGDNQITFSVRKSNGSRETWNHTVTDNSTWSRYLLDNKELDIYNHLSAKADRLVDSVKFDVSIVTGANQYFCINKTTLQGFELDKWAEPLLPRLRMAPGLIYTEEDHVRNEQADESTYILNFSDKRPDPKKYEKPLEYINIGEEVNLHQRYKCSIRQPWYRVPNMIAGEMLLSKRSHYSPRIVINSAGVLTTDTIYRGKIHRLSPFNAMDVATSFHSSLTLLSAEIEGRSFGGGVLELVPSEISRLRILLVEGIGRDLHKLDKKFRESGEESFDDLISETDSLILKSDPRATKSDFETLEKALKKMRQRRFERN